eukprot:909094-Pelagomonas_calceolata.AAC.1
MLKPPGIRSACVVSLSKLCSPDPILRMTSLKRRVTVTALQPDPCLAQRGRAAPLLLNPSCVFEAQFDFKDEDARLCSSTKECKMSLTIPLSSNLPNDRTAACVRLVPEEEEDGTGAFSPELAIPEAEVSEDGFQAICKVSRLGRYVV